MTADRGEDEHDDGDAIMEHVNTSQGSPAKAAGWDVVAIVKRKIVFSTRPMPIVGRPT
jgi:chromosome transmission fidelity protein 8